MGHNTHWGSTENICFLTSDSLLLVRRTKYITNQMDASLWGSPHLFSLTQHKLILIEKLILHVCYTFRLVFKPSSGMSTQIPSHCAICQHTAIQQYCQNISRTYLLISLSNVLQNFYLAQNLQTEFKEGFSERIRYIDALPRQLAF
jgi:hypothetical protein